MRTTAKNRGTIAAGEIGACITRADIVRRSGFGFRFESVAVECWWPATRIQVGWMCALSFARRTPAHTAALDVSACVFAGQIDKSRVIRTAERPAASRRPCRSERKRGPVGRRQSSNDALDARLTDDRGLFFLGGNRSVFLTKFSSRFTRLRREEDSNAWERRCEKRDRKEETARYLLPVYFIAASRHKSSLCTPSIHSNFSKIFNTFVYFYNHMSS